MAYPPYATLIFILSLLAVTAADDSAVMSRLLKSLTPAPSGWSETTSFCKWDGILCDDSNRVISMNLPSQSLAGTLPPDLNSLTHLTSLSLEDNNLSGPLPSLANLSLLQTVSLSRNNFTRIPEGCFRGLTSLRSLNLSNNPNLAPWTIPTDLTHSSNLTVLKLRSSKVVGSLPNIFNSFPSLQTLDLSYNNITGGLPDSLAASGIENLRLNNQSKGLSGTTEVLSSMTHLSRVWIHSNQFTGPIPDLSKCKDLSDLQLSNNQFTGVVPSSLMRLSSLLTVSLGNNLLQGPVPEFGKGVKVTLDGKNSFCRPIAGPCDPRVMALLRIAEAFRYPTRIADSWKGNDPCQLWSFVVCTDGKITILNFAEYNFGGTISPAFADLKDLRYLYLDGNNLTGSVPQSLTTLPHLESLDVSNNNLSGKVPMFPSRLKLNTAGNILLESANGTSLAPRWIAAIAIITISLTAVMVFISCKLFSRDRNRDNGNDTYPIKVLRRATNGFSDRNKLGSGGYGVVYRGELRNGKKIAVKKIKPVAMGSKGFESEIAVLSKVKHENLVELLGHCTDDDERLLVYEYMPQGTLEKHLFEWQKHGLAPLPWENRVEIALDVANGLDYLHNWLLLICS